jgi:hypothetical protein
VNVTLCVVFDDEQAIFLIPQLQSEWCCDNFRCRGGTYRRRTESKFDLGSERKDGYYKTQVVNFDMLAIRIGIKKLIGGI